MPKIDGNENVMQKEKRGIEDVPAASSTGEMAKRAQLRTTKREA